jgi:hypothetical protein
MDPVVRSGSARAGGVGNAGLGLRRRDNELVASLILIEIPPNHSEEFNFSPEVRPVDIRFGFPRRKLHFADLRDEESQ